jgi:hypothetical protein
MRSLAVGAVNVTVAPDDDVAGTRKSIGTLVIAGGTVSTHTLAPGSELVPAGQAIACVAPDSGT